MKKSDGLLCHRVEWQSAFIADHQRTWPVGGLGDVWRGSRSGFYDDQRRQAAPALLAQITVRAEKTPHRYGSRRLAKPLQGAGDQVGRFKGRRLMKPAGIAVQSRRRRRPTTTESRHSSGVAPNLLERHFDVLAPKVGWG